MADNRVLTEEKKQKGIVGIRNCPKCNSEMYYTDKWYYNDSIKKQRRCVACKRSAKGIRFFGEDNPNWKGSSDPKNWVRSCYRCRNEIVYDNYEAYRKAKNKKYSCGCVRRINVSPKYNPDACKIFEEINDEMDWSGQHAENGGEYFVLKYFVDYYEPTLNLVIEYDESHHKYNSETDETREQEIVDHLQCKFIRINEGEDWKIILKEQF